MTTIDVYDINISIEHEISFSSIYNLAVLYSSALNYQKSIACYLTKTPTDNTNDMYHRSTRRQQYKTSKCLCKIEEVFIHILSTFQQNA